MRALAEDGYAGLEVRVIPIRTEIIVRVTRTREILRGNGVSKVPDAAKNFCAVRRDEYVDSAGEPSWLKMCADLWRVRYHSLRFPPFGFAMKEISSNSHRRRSTKMIMYR